MKKVLNVLIFIGGIIAAPFWVICLIIIVMFYSCDILPKPEEVNVYFCGGQSNATPLWGETIKNRILEKDPTAIVVHNWHPAQHLHKWYDEEPKEFYIEDMGIVKDSIKGFNYNIAGFFWFQGESDIHHSSTYDNYEKRFYGFMNQISEDFNDHDFNVYMTVIFGSIWDRYKVDYIRNVQEKMISDNNNYYGIDSIVYDRKEDGVHLLFESQIQIANDMINQFF